MSDECENKKENPHIGWVGFNEVISVPVAINRLQTDVAGLVSAFTKVNDCLRVLTKRVDVLQAEVRRKPIERPSIIVPGAGAPGGAVPKRRIHVHIDKKGVPHIVNPIQVKRGGMN